MSSDIVRASEMDAKINYAKALAASDLLPDSYRGKPANVLVALELGSALGLAPTTALYGINVIKGRPTLGAETMRAVVLAQGHRFDVTEFTETQATVVVARKERPADTSTFTFTLDDAKRAGLMSGNYEKYPKAMLLARVSSQACRAIFPDVLAGVSYTPDELDDTPQDAPARPVERVHAPTEDEWAGPPVDDAGAIVDAEIVTEEPPARTKDPAYTPEGRHHSANPAPATNAQIQSIVKLCRAQHITPDTLAQFASERLGFTMPETVDLVSKAQASAIITALTEVQT